MKLRSRFQDYYDGLASTDREATPLFVREQRTVAMFGDKDFAALDEWKPVIHLFHRMPCPKAGHKVVVLFCGTAVFGWVWGPPSEPCEHQPWDGIYEPQRWTRSGKKTRFFTDLPSLDAAVLEEWVPKSLSGRSIQAEYAKHRDSTWASGIGDQQRVARDPRRQFHPNPKGYALWATERDQVLGGIRNRLIEIHRREQTPILRITGVSERWLSEGWYIARQQGNSYLIQADSNLGSLGLASLIPAYDAWQKIDMFLGNEMAVQRDPLPLDDVYRRDAHGFDAFSFKNIAPGERKKRRAAKVT
jgi:hypothetical protein